MMDTSLEKDILEELDRLDPSQQLQVLHFVRALVLTRPAGVPGKDLLRFAGTIDAQDLAIMTQAIEEGCEKVNPDEW